MDASHFHSYTPAEGHGLAHDPLNAIVGPRPIGWISTLGADGVRNLAPYSFFNLFSYTPPIIGFCSIGEKDSLNNARETGAFVWNLVTRAQAEAMNMSCAAVRADVDEFALAGLDALPSDVVAPPRVAGSPVQFECRVTQIVRLATLSGAPTASWMVFGEAVRVHIDPACIVESVYRTALPEPILRGGGPADYFAVTGDRRFEMRRPAPPPGMAR